MCLTVALKSCVSLSLGGIDVEFQQPDCVLLPFLRPHPFPSDLWKRNGVALKTVVKICFQYVGKSQGVQKGGASLRFIVRNHTEKSRALLASLTAVRVPSESDWISITGPTCSAQDMGALLCGLSRWSHLPRPDCPMLC